MPWYKRNQDIWRELFFFVILLAVGGLVISYNASLIGHKEFLSSIFFASGFIPLNQSFIFDFIPRVIGNQDSKLRLEETFSTLLSAIFLFAALLIYPKPEDDGDAWDIVSGKTLFEAGLIYFITRVLFFVPNPLDEIRKLKNEIVELKQSMAIGLADGYFWNLAREIAVDVRDAHGTLPLWYKRDDPPVLKSIYRFLIIVPRQLSSELDDPIAHEINTQKRNDKFKDCQIRKSPLREHSSRQKWVTDLICYPSSTELATGPSMSSGSTKEESNKIATNQGEYPQGIIFDIPTTITAVLMSLRDYSKGDEGKNKKIDNAKFQKEISTFTHRLAWQLQKAKLDDYGKVIEVENLDDIVNTIISVHDHFQDLDKGVSMALDHSGAKVIDLGAAGMMTRTRIA